MSYTEIRAREGLPYGGMPYDVIAEKLEETDPDLVGEVRGYDEFSGVEDDYGNYVRSEIIDWGSDAPFLESDHARRDPGLSRSLLNLRLNGTRGSQPELPRHPELFYGFTGNDPRGVVNDPRFDEVRGHVSARAANLTARMGDNDDHQLAERPWTAQSISYGMKEVQRRLKGSTRVFAVQKEGRPWGNNTVADWYVGGDLRAAQLGVGAEALAYQTGSARFAAGDYDAAADRFADGARGVGVWGDTARPHRHAASETDMGAQALGPARGAGRAHLGPGATGGGRARAGGAEQDWAESRAGRGANRQVLGAAMAQAARRPAGQADQDWAAGLAPARFGAGPAPSRDVARLYRRVAEDQSRRPEGEVQDGEARGPAAGLSPAAHPERARRAAEAQATPNAHLTNAESIAVGLREGSAAGRRRIAGLVVADGTRPGGEAEAGTRRGAAPSQPGHRARATDAPLLRAAAAGDLEVHAYRGAPPGRPDGRAAAARDADDTVWSRQHEALPLGRSKAAGEWRSATQGQTSLGDDAAAVFGADAVVIGRGMAVGPKSLRPGGASDSAGLSDTLGDV